MMLRAAWQDKGKNRSRSGCEKVLPWSLRHDPRLYTSMCQCILQRSSEEELPRNNEVLHQHRALDSRVLYVHNKRNNPMLSTQLTTAAGVSFLKCTTGCSRGTLFSFNCCIFNASSAACSFSYFAISSLKSALP